MFDVTDENITVGRERRTDAFVTKSQIDWKGLSENLRSYVRARSDIQMMEAELRGQGIIGPSA